MRSECGEFHVVILDHVTDCSPRRGRLSLSLSESGSAHYMLNMVQEAPDNSMIARSIVVVRMNSGAVDTAALLENTPEYAETEVGIISSQICIISNQ